jgi:hypothetical protein
MSLSGIRTFPLWLAFARALDPQAYQVVFVPDASMHGVATMPEIQGFDIFDPACWNIELRAALYGRAWMHIGVACGPLAISALMAHVVTVMIDRSQDYPADYLNGIRSVTGVLPGERPAFYSRSSFFTSAKTTHKPSRDFSMNTPSKIGAFRLGGCVQWQSGYD